jgi:uncharacterized RDD family membrane protein YckC
MDEKAKGPFALEFAGFWRRLGAFVLDLVAVAVISSLFTPFRWFGLVGFWDNGNIFDTPLWFGLPLLAVGELISFVITAAFFVGFWVWRGQTPGKMVAGIKVIRCDGTDVTIGTALLRYLGYIVSAAILFIGFFWIAFDERNQGIHDKMADTYVVKIPQPLPAAPTAGAGA